MTLCPEMETETKPLPARERPATLKQKVMVAPNKPFYCPVIIILAATAGLAALGLLFCWKSPIGEWLHPGSNWFFKRQLVYLMIGVFGGVLAVYLAGWRRCVKAGHGQDSRHADDRSQREDHLSRCTRPCHLDKNGKVSLNAPSVLNETIKTFGSISEPNT